MKSLLFFTSSVSVSCNREELCFNEGIDKTLSRCVQICFQEYSFYYVKIVAKALGSSVLSHKKGKFNC